jgi:hypothetical protein
MKSALAPKCLPRDRCLFVALFFVAMRVLPCPS